MKAWIVKNIIYVAVGVLLLGLISGFFVGRATTKPGVKIEYVNGETITTTVNKPYPVEVQVPAKPVLPLIPDTFYVDSIQYVTLKVDTAKIIADYVKRNRYTVKAFDDKNGKLIITPVVQYNLLDSLGYEFTPITKVITKTQEKIFTPFINASWNSFGYVGAGGGLYYHNVGVGAKYMTDFTNNGFEVNLNIKF